MRRRAFLGSLIGGVAATAAVRTWPFRVFSFPSTPRLLTLEEQYRLGVLGEVIGFDWYGSFEMEKLLPIGTILTIRNPERFLINPKTNLLVDKELFTVDSWNPRTEELIVTRG